jgi:hypothetical protein
MNMKKSNLPFVVMLTVSILFSSKGFAEEKEVADIGPPPGIAYGALSQNDKDLLRKGEISQAQLLAGGFLGTFIGFGAGHLPYEMYSSRGWIFTAGEVATLALAIVGATGVNNDCTVQPNGFRKCEDVGGSRAAVVVGVLGFLGLRIWEVIDVWTIPSARNYDIRRIRQKMGRDLTDSSWVISPTLQASGAPNKRGAGLNFSFRF